MNRSLYVLIVSFAAVSSSLYSAEIADAHKKQVVLHPRVAAHLKSLPPLAPHAKEWLNSKGAVSGSLCYPFGYSRPILFDYVDADAYFQHLHELLVAGADVNAKDSNGEMAIARSLDKPLQLQLLLDYKADPNIISCTGVPLLNQCCYDTGFDGTPLNPSSSRQKEYCKSLLILLSDSRIKIDARDGQNYTPLGILLSQLIEENLSCIEQLIACGANPLCTGLDGKNAFDLLVTRTKDSKKISLTRAALKLFDDQRKAEGMWPKEGILPTIEECTVLLHDPASIVAQYAVPPAHVSDPGYHKKLDAAIEAVEKSAIQVYFS